MHLRSVYLYIGRGSCCVAVKAGSHLVSWKPKIWLPASLAGWQHIWSACKLGLQADCGYACTSVPTWMLADDGEPPETCCFDTTQAKAPQTKCVGEAVVCAKGRERRIPLPSARHYWGRRGIFLYLHEDEEGYFPSLTSAYRERYSVLDTISLQKTL